MILREMYVDGDSVIKHSGAISILDCIGISDSFDGDVSYIDDKSKILDLFKSKNLFGVVRIYKDTDNIFHAQCFVLYPEEVELLDYIDEVQEIRGTFPSNKSFIISRVLLFNKYRIFMGDCTRSLMGSKYWTILDLLLSNDFKLQDNGFYIKYDDRIAISSINGLVGCFYKLCCSEDEFMRFITKLKVLKR